jgi:hypothetical protein
MKAAYIQGNAPMHSDHYTGSPSELVPYIKAGWRIVSETAAGVQLEKPKSMRALDKGALVLGILCLAFWGLGIILIAIALLDYAFFTKAEMKFLPRAAAIPPPRSL